MIDSYSRRVLSRVRRSQKYLAAIGALSAAALCAPPALAEVEPGRNLELNHSIQLGVLEGWTPGTTVRVDVLRGSTLIATKTDVVDPNDKVGGILEINHVGGDDCWQGVPAGTTPDVKPGDKVVATVLATDPVTGALTDTADVDYTYVRNISFDENADGTVTGFARGVETSPGVFDLNAPVDVAANVMEAKRVGSPEESDYPFVPSDLNGSGAFTNVDVGGTPRAGELFIDFLDESGGGTGTTVAFRNSDAPEIPCGAITTTGLTSNSHEVINLNNVGTDMLVGGPRQDGVDVTLTFNGNDYAVDQSTAGAWSATIPAADIGALAEGSYDLAASFSDGSPSETRTVRKDVTAPVLSADLAPGSYAGKQAVALRSDGGEVVRFTQDGSSPVSASRAYDGTRLSLDGGRHTIRAFAVDAAGNRGDATFEYTVTVPAVAAATTLITPPSLTFGRNQVENISVRPLAVRSLALARRISVTRLYVQGLRASMRLQEGTAVVRIGIYRARKGKRVGKALALGYRAPRAAGLYRVRMRDRRLLRRLRPGQYVMEVAAGTSRSNLGRTSRIAFTVTR